MTGRRKGRIGKERSSLVLQSIAEGRTAIEIAALLCVDPETVRKFARRRRLSIQKADQTGPNHPCWKGGTVVDRSGYILRRVQSDGPYGYLIRAIARRGHAGQDNSGYAPEHRIVMHDRLGRRLVPGEVVDHIDGNKQNNAPENLRLFARNSDHLRATLTGKVPNWTPEGRSRMTGRPPRRQEQETRPVPTFSHPKTDDPE